MTAPTLLSPEDCKQLAQRVLAMVRGSQVQVAIRSDHRSSTQFVRGAVHQSSETGSPSVRLEVRDAAKRSLSETNQVDEIGLQALVREVEAITRGQRTPVDLLDDELLGPQTYTAGPPIFFDATLAAMAGDAQADLFRRVTDATETAGLVGAADVVHTVAVRSVLNTQGLRVYERSTWGEISLTVRTRDGTGSGWAWSGYEDWRRVDVQAVIARAVDLARRSARPVAVEPGRYTVILEPTAVAELITPISWIPTQFWSAQAADAGQTVFSHEPLGTNKIGHQMMDRRLRMVSDPWDPERPASTISQDWRPLVPVDWFQAGVLRNLAYDPPYARQQGRAPVINPGGVRLVADGPAQTLEEMIASTKRGIWVNRFSGVSVMNDRTLLLTGTTRDGTFLVEDGKITKPIKNFRFTESPFFVLNQLEAWGEPVRGSPWVVAPRLKLRDFNFTSLTEAV